MVVVIRRFQLRRRPESGFAQAAAFIVRQQGGGPVGGAGDAMEAQAGAVLDKDLAAGKAHLLRVGFHQGGGDVGQPRAHLQRRLVHGAGHGAGEAAGIVAGGDRPGVLAGVQLHIDQDAGRVHAQHLGHHLGHHGLVTLALGRGGDVRGDAAEGIDAEGGGAHRAVLRARLGALFRGQGGGDVAHIGNRRLHHRAQAHAVQFALGPGLVTASDQLIVAAVAQGQVHGAGVVAGIQQGAGGGAVGEGVRRQQIAAHHFQRVQVQLAGHLVHQTLQGEVHLAATKTPVQAAGQFVGEHHPVAHRQIADAVGAGQVAVHAIEGGRLRRAQIAAAVVDLVVAQGGDAAVRVHRRLHVRHPVGGAGRGLQMLQPVLHPFHRGAGLARRQAHQHHIAEHALLDAEAAAGVRRRAQPQPVAGHVQRPRHHRMQRVGALEVGKDVVDAGGRLVLAHHHVALDGGAGVAREPHLDGNPMLRLLEGFFRIAVAEVALVDHVAAHRLVQHRRVLGGGFLRIDHRLQRLVLHPHQIQGVLRPVAVLGDHHAHRLAHIAHLVHRQAPVLHGRAAHAHRERMGPALHVLAGEHRAHALEGERLGGVHGQHPGMGMGGAHDGGVQGARRRRQVVGVSAQATQQGLILETGLGPADVTAIGAGLGAVIAHPGLFILLSESPSVGRAPWRCLAGRDGFLLPGRGIYLSV